MKFRIMVVVLVLLLNVYTAFSADTDIDGKWTGSYSTGFGEPMNMEFTFKADGNVFTGTTLGGANGEQIPILEGKIDSNKISFTVVVDMMGQQMVFKYMGEFSKNKKDKNKDKIKLKFETGSSGSGGSFTVNRAKEKKTKK